MNKLIKLLAACTLLLTSTHAMAVTECDIETMLSCEEFRRTENIIAIDKHQRELDDIEYICKPIRYEEGTYNVDVQKIASNIYKIYGYNLAVKTRFCYEYASYRTEAVVVIESTIGIIKGKIIFE